jgi:TonB family protein
MSEASSRARKDAASAPSPSYLWEVSGKPVSVRISFDVIDRLDREAVENFRSISARGSEIGGLLLGSAGADGVVSIVSYEPVACDYSRGPLYRLSDADLARFDAAIGGHANDRLSVVGFFRSHTRKGLSLDSDDQTLLKSRLADPKQIALLVRPFATKASAGGIFIWEDGQVIGEASPKEFPFQSAQLSPAGEPAPAAAVPVASQKVARGRVIPMTRSLELAPAEPPMELQPPEPAPAPVEPPPAVEVKNLRGTERKEAQAAKPPEPAPGEVSAAPEEAGRGFKINWLWAAVGAAILACSGLLFVYPGLLRKPARPMIPLSLRIEHTATDLLLTWNKDSEAVRRAQRGVLTIADGDRRENYSMTQKELGTGSIVYPPVTGDVSFSLEVIGPNQADIANESVRVLRSRPSPMPEEDAKAAGKNAQAAAQHPDAAVPAPADSEPEAEQPTKLAKASRKFDVGSLAQRLRPALPSDVPVDPAFVAPPTASGVTVSMGAIIPVQLPSAARPASPTPAPTGAPAASQVRQAELISKRDPEYPAFARQARASGAVHVVAVIGVDGKIKSARAISGHALLQRAAVDAVKQWVYKPTILNGTPIEATTEVILNFNAAR